MSDRDEMEKHLANLSREEVMSALFANLIVQHTNMAFMFLGRMPHPESGEVAQDLESAKFFIDQLEMIEFKTRGNLEKQEETLLKQSLTGLRIAFVEAVNARDKTPAEERKTEAAAQGKPAEESPKAPEPPGTQADEESRKKFTKKY